MSDFDQFDTARSQEAEKETGPEKQGEETAQGGRRHGAAPEENSAGSGSGSGSSPTDAVGSVANTAGNAVGQTTGQVAQSTEGMQKTITGLTKADTDAMAGSLKIHVTLALEVDIRIIARLKGDIAVGIL